MKKRLLVLFLTILLALSLMPVSASAEGAAWMTFYVSPSGSDTADGSKASPFKTPARAQEEVRKHNQNMQGNIEVILMPGRYVIDKHLEFEVEDSGSNGYDVIWKSADKDNLATLSGAKEVTGTWEQGDDGIWHVKAENLEFVRELFINDKIATRARSTKKIFAKAHYTKAENYTHPHYGEQTTRHLGYYVDKSKLGLYENPEDVEFHWIMMFRTALFHVDDIIQDPADENQVIAIMDRTYWNEFMVASAGKPQVELGRGFIVENAYELLDEPGEFYFNKKTKVLSYIPREGEDLNSAEILVPEYEQAIFVRGENLENCVKNVRFENIRFAHFTNYEYEEGNITGGQAEYHFASNIPYFVGRSTFLVDWADDIAIESCVFYGLSGIALHLRNGVYNSTVQGNVFADIGATQLCVGTKWHDEIHPPVANDGPKDAAWHAPWSASYHYWPGTAYTYQALNTQRYQEESMGNGAGWYSEPWAKEEGTLPWLMLELEAAVKLESFQFKFPSNATLEERSNFEVLISNDRSFKDYKTIATYTSAANMDETIEIGDGEEYRYIMLRKTKAEPFCLSSVWAWTYDREVQGADSAPQNCVIANNYFTRAAQQKQGSYPIWINYTKNFQVLHNDIHDAPYAGITIGWGWYWPNDTSRANKVNYNRIDNVMTYMDDGAGIYVLGRMYGSELIGNYISNTTLDGMAIYYDQGTAGVTAIDNVSVNTNEFFNLNSRSEGNSIKNSYNSDRNTFDAFGAKATHQVNPNGTSIIRYSTYEVPIDIELPTVFSLNDPPDEARRIMAEAGLEDEWLWILERVPEADSQKIILEGPDASESKQIMSSSKSANVYVESDTAIAEHMLETGTFGNLPWHFSPESKIELEYYLNAVKTDTSRTDDFSTGHIEEQFALKAAIKEANATVIHPSYDEMLKMCDELVKDEKNYPASAVASFKNTIEAVKATNPESRGEKAVAAGKLERAYSALYEKGYTSEITGVVVRGGKTTIDRENKKVTVKLPIDKSFKDATPAIFVSKGSRLAVKENELNFKKGYATVPLYNETSKKYSYWKVELELADSGSADKANADPNEWLVGNPNVPFYNVGGSMTIEPWFTPTMNKKLFDNKLSLSLNVPRADTADGIGIIFGSQTNDLEPTTKDSKNTYYMAKIVDQSLTLYRVKGGESTAHITVDDIYFEYGKFNNIEITVTEENDLDRVIISLEGEVLLDTLVDEPIGKVGYFGILSKNMALKVK